jgi:cell division septal protein FtsQ
MSVRAPAEKNFRRANVRPGSRRSGRRRWSWRLVRLVASIALAGYASYRAVDLVASAPMLRVKRIAVHGNVRLSGGEIQTLVDGLRGVNILAVDLERYRRRVLDSPWVADVAMRRVLPSTIEVFISERRPMGLCRMGGRLYLVDRSGTLIAEFGPEYGEFDLPIIDGLVRPPASGQPAIDEQRAALAGRVLDAVAERADLSQRISQIDVADLHDAVLLLEGDPTLLHVGDEQFVERLQSYVDLAPALRERIPEIDSADLRYKGRVICVPASAAARRTRARQ